MIRTRCTGTDNGEGDEAYLRFLARKIETPEQFEAIIAQVTPKLRFAVRSKLLPMLKWGGTFKAAPEQTTADEQLVVHLKASIPPDL